MHNRALQIPAMNALPLYLHNGSALRLDLDAAQRLLQRLDEFLHPGIGLVGGDEAGNLAEQPLGGAAGGIADATAARATGGCQRQRHPRYRRQCDRGLRIAH